MTRNVLSLPGLDGQNPLGFFAALGLLRIADDEARRSGGTRPTLAFSSSPPFTAQLGFAGTIQDLQALVLRDADAQRHSVPLQIAYDDAGELVPPETPGATRDLKLSPSAARALLERAALLQRRDADLCAGLLSDVVQDNNDASKPTAFHFTAGQQAFLSMVESLRTGLDTDSLDEALLGPWRNTSKLPSLGWDSSVARIYALRAANPSGEKRGSVPAANWLAVNALAFFPVMPEHRRDRVVLRTTNVAIGWKDVPFAWPLWTEAAEAEVLRSLLRLDPTRFTQRERSALGISTVCRSRILRSDQGGYGSFTPAEIVPPRSTTK